MKNAPKVACLITRMMKLREWFSLGACDASTEDCRARGRVGLIFVHRNGRVTHFIPVAHPSTAKG